MANAQKKFKQYDKAVIKGKAYWTKLDQVDEYSHKYQIDVGQLDKKSIETLEKNGVILKKKDAHPSESPFVIARTTRQVRVIDKERNPFDVNMTKIGNGSEVKVKVAFNKDHPFADKYGTALYLDMVQVLDLVEYHRDEVDDDFD